MPTISWRSNAMLQHEADLATCSVICQPKLSLFLDNWRKQPVSLILTGDPGLGKTHLAVALLKEYAKLNPLSYSCQYISARDIEAEMDKEMAEYKRPANYLLDELASTPGLLVVDDLGAERASDYLERAFFRLIDQRLNSLTIWTSNLSWIDIGQRYGPRISSRLRVCLPIAFSGNDQRHQPNA